jgi:hypothetical protein
MGSMLEDCSLVSEITALTEERTRHAWSSEGETNSWNSRKKASKGVMSFNDISSVHSSSQEHMKRCE